MSFDLPAELEHDLNRYAQASHQTPAEALRTLIQDGLRKSQLEDWEVAPPTGDPERLIGAFADMPNFVEIVADVIATRADRYKGER